MWECLSDHRVMGAGLAMDAARLNVIAGMGGFGTDAVGVSVKLGLI